MIYTGISNIKVYNSFDFGFFSDVYKCDFEGSRYAYKKYIFNEFPLTKDIIEKMDLINNIGLEGSLLPSIAVTSRNKLIGYLTKLIDVKEDRPSKEDLLKIKKSILELHENNIIHTDLHGGNMLFSDNESYIIDFDNCVYKNYFCDFDRLGYKSLKFISKYGLTNDLDIYMFNLFTLEILGKNSEENLLELIRNDSYEYTSKEQKSICKSLLLDEKTFNHEFLVDTF